MSPEHIALYDRVRTLLRPGDEGHPTGDLDAHLRETYTLLLSWQAPSPVCLAGLFHAIYGTYGFEPALIGLERRSDIAEIIGSEAEALLYLYAACDRPFCHPQLARSRVQWRDRFTGQISHPPPEHLAAFCELTLANEIEVLRHEHM